MDGRDRWRGNTEGEMEYGIMIVSRVIGSKSFSIQSSFRKISDICLRVRRSSHTQIIKDQSIIFTFVMLDSRILLKSLIENLYTVLSYCDHCTDLDLCGWLENYIVFNVIGSWNVYGSSESHVDRYEIAPRLKRSCRTISFERRWCECNLLVGKVLNVPK